MFLVIDLSRVEIMRDDLHVHQLVIAVAQILNKLQNAAHRLQFDQIHHITMWPYHSSFLLLQKQDIRQNATHIGDAGGPNFFKHAVAGQMNKKQGKVRMWTRRVRW